LAKRDGRYALRALPKKKKKKSRKGKASLKKIRKKPLKKARSWQHRVNRLD
jgi:hypothetical protein